MKVIVCIPARYESTRFANKVLARDTGKFLIQHTYEQACKAKLPDLVLIATDHNAVLEAAKTFGAECVMTSTDCPSGTDRIAEAILKVQSSNFEVQSSDIIVNLQADEPEINPANIDTVAKLLIDNPEAPMATLAAEFQSEKQIRDPNIVKIVVTQYAQRSTHNAPVRAIYFSRSVIPYDRAAAGVGPVGQYLRHLGIYAFRKDYLLEFTNLPQGKLEQIEKLEQLRVIENAYTILVAKVKHTCDGIDTPEQYADFVKRYKSTTDKM
jgi:3-deoxy-manno-octulosonate cytidylyltransferase (CMP-KDO synthetase)